LFNGFESQKSLVEPYLADIEEDPAETLIRYAIFIADENTATCRDYQPTKVVVLAGVIGDEWLAVDGRGVVHRSLQAGDEVEQIVHESFFREQVLLKLSPRPVMTAILASGTGMIAMPRLATRI
jgi:hypothetical protein